VKEMQKEKISSLQMAILLYPTIVATIIISVPSILAKYAQNDLWISPIISSSIGFITVYCVYQLHKRYPNQTVIQYSEQILGRFPGKIVGLFFLLFYIHITGLILRSYSEFLITSFLYHTPSIVIMGTMVLLCAVAVYCGIEVLARIAQVFIPAFVLPLFIFFLLLAPDYEFHRIFPILANGILPPIKAAIVSNSWYSEIFLMSFLLPHVADIKKGGKYGAITVLAVMLTLVSVSLIVLFVLGHTTSTKTYPLMAAGRYISIADFFENLESVAMAVWILGAFIKISVFYYSSALGLSQWLNLSDYRTVVWPLAILIMEFGFWTMPSQTTYIRFISITLPFYGVIIQTLIPLFLLLAAVLWKKRNRKGTKSM
jgi:spore germination protein KB